MHLPLAGEGKLDVATGGSSECECFDCSTRDELRGGRPVRHARLQVPCCGAESRRRERILSPQCGGASAGGDRCESIEITCHQCFVWFLLILHARRALVHASFSGTRAEAARVSAGDSGGARRRARRVALLAGRRRAACASEMVRALLRSCRHWLRAAIDRPGRACRSKDGKELWLESKRVRCEELQASGAGKAASERRHVSLSLDASALADAGTYVLLASNRKGSATRSAQLQIDGMLREQSRAAATRAPHTRSRHSSPHPSHTPVPLLLEFPPLYPLPTLLDTALSTRIVAPRARPDQLNASGSTSGNELIVRRGANARLAIYAEGSPKPTVGWARNGSSVEIALDASRTRVTEQAASSTAKTHSSSAAAQLLALNSSLAIRDVLPAHVSALVATATNRAGSCSVSFVLRVLGARCSYIYMHEYNRTVVATRV